MKTDLTNRNHTRQSHIIVNARYALSRAEIDIVLTLLTAIKKEDEDFKDYEFTIGELQTKTGRRWDAKQLKATIKSLMSKPLELPVEHDEEFEIVNWFSYFKYSRTGLITCRFDKKLKPYLIQLSGTRVLADLRHLLLVNSSYSKRMYLLLKEYDKMGIRTFNVEELQAILKVPKSFKAYGEFKKKVLQRAEIDINKFTDLEVKLSEKKRGKKVVEITYTIKKNHTDLKAFIANIREVYPNVLLYHSKNGRPLKCSDKGLLYYSDNMENINKKESIKLWEYLHENKARLTCFQGNLFNEEEVIKTLTNAKN
jgi:plasmid replication initiation protein